MAEAVTLVGLVAAIVQFASISAKIMHRLNEYRETTSAVPDVLTHIHSELPLLVNTLERTRANAESNLNSTETNKALLPVIQNCHKEVKSLSDTISKLLPKQNDSSLKRFGKAFSSLGQEKKINHISTQLRHHVQVLTYYQVSASSYIKSTETLPLFWLPFERDPAFTGRSDVLHKIESSFSKGSRVALYGIGGIGKSQIAIEFCYRYRHQRPRSNVLWLYARDRRRLEQSYRAIARKLCLSGWENLQEDIIPLMYSWLNDETHGPWLLVLDNADSLDTFFDKSFATASTYNESLINQLPHASNGSILITTRDGRVANRLTDERASIQVNQLSQAEGEELLRSKLPLMDRASDANIRDLLEALAFLPLAITQACAFMREKKYSLTEYLGLFQEHEDEIQDVLNEDLGDLRRDLANGNSITRTWRLSFDQISKQNPRAAQMLSLMSMFDRQGIPTDLLREPGERTLEFKAAMATLSLFSLVNTEVSGTRLSLHQLVQLSIRAWLKQENTESYWREQALAAIAARLPSGEYESWAVCASLSSHVQAVRKFTFNSRSSLISYASVIQRAARYDETQGRYEDACAESAKALEIYESILGLDDVTTLASISSLASATRGRNDFQSAEELHRRAFEGRLHLLGPDHQDTLRSMSDLAYVLGNRGQPQASEDLNRRALAGRERLLGETHLEVLVSKTNLAMVLDYQGKYAEAEKLHRQVLSARDTILGPKHPDTLTSARNLALVLDYQKKHEEANQLNLRALNGRAEVLGWRHPDTLASASNYANILKYSGRLEECEMTNRWVLEQRREILGAQHDWTLFSLGNLADVLKAQGRLEEAEEANKEALSGYIATLGWGHAHTLNCASILASVLDNHGKYEEAEELYCDILKRREESLGRNHLATAEAYDKLCAFYGNRGDTEKLNTTRTRWEISEQDK